MITIKFYCWSTRDTFYKTNVAIIISRLFPLILISTLFMKTRGAMYLSLNTIARVVAFKYPFTSVLGLSSAFLFLADVLQGNWFFRIHNVYLRITVPAVFSFLEFRVLFTVIPEMIRWTFATSTLFCLTCIILANKSIVNVMFFLFP